MDMIDLIRFGIITGLFDGTNILFERLAATNGTAEADAQLDIDTFD